MDQMLPSPGFSIPSIGTPLHQPEEDQQIIANQPYPQYAQQMVPPMAHMGNTGSLGMSSMGGSMSGLQQNSMQNMGLPSLMHTPAKLPHSTYQPSYATPQSMMQPQTPVSSNV